jgi:hypothetical protein
MNVLNNWFVKKSYGVKTYFDIGISQISWVTGKFPELMAVLYLSEKFGYEFSMSGMITLIIIVILSLVFFGYYWKQLGFYDVDRYTVTKRDPVMTEILDAARIIKKNEVRRKK